MNSVYQKLRGEFDNEESYSGGEVMQVVLTVIKVIVSLVWMSLILTCIPTFFTPLPIHPFSYIFSDAFWYLDIHLMKEWWRESKEELLPHNKNRQWECFFLYYSISVKKLFLYWRFTHIHQAHMHSFFDDDFHTHTHTRI